MKIDAGLAAGMVLLAIAGCDPAVPAHSATFELCRIASAEDSGATLRPVRGSSDRVPVLLPPLLSGADLSGVKAVTRSAWYILSGRHSTSQVVLTVRPEALPRWQQESRLAVGRGDRLAMVLDGKVIAVLVRPRVPEGRDFGIDASFFSIGTERQKARDATTLANQIRASMR